MSIVTMYRGVEYRSRLEARWAAFFTRLGWPYTYEPFDGDGYIPDFLIHGDAPLLVEVKPAATITEYEAPVGKATRGLAGHWTHDILIAGASPLPTLPDHFGFGEWHPAAGLLGELLGMDGERPAWWFQPGQWMRCAACGGLGVFHPELTYRGRPCGHYEGDHYLGGVDTDRLRAAWAEACNDVKWRGRDAA